MRFWWHSFLLLLIAAGCGDDGDGMGPRDAAPPTDARFLSDAAHQSCSADQNPCADLDFETICDPARSYCVECVTPADCAPASTFGSRCEASDGTCRCDEHDDCQSKDNGSYCHPIVSACGCLTIDDCPANTECKLAPYLGTGIRRCQPVQ